MPSGLNVIPSALGIHTRLTPFASYSDHRIFRRSMSSYFCASSVQISLSGPGVFLPPLVVTRLTAIALAPNDVKISLWVLLISLPLALDFNAPYNLACSSFKFEPAFLQLMFFQGDRIGLLIHSF